ncbi:MAG: hypothetical protein Q7R35_06650 [Elusimicrobiota bacterium]|nr:hypothetical protein [Elusimicrobiota bacterium]
MKKVETGKIIVNKLLTGLGRALSFSAILFLAYGFLPMALHSEVPVRFTYQGNLRQAGFLVNGNRNMVFRIYDSSTSGTELCPGLVHNNVSISTGVFRVVLEPAIADWQTGSLWLEIEIAGNRLSPREELTSSPYSINSLMFSGKRYTTAVVAPSTSAVGDLWYDSSLKAVNFWNGTAWMTTSGAGLPGAHAATHSGSGIDPIVSLGAHGVTGYITVSSSVSAGWLAGDGAGVYNLDASKISFGYLNGDRLGNVIVSTHIMDGSILNQDLADGSVTREKINQSGCADGEFLRLSGASWVCFGGLNGLETDPLSIHNQGTLQAGTTFYVSSGTVNDFNISNSLKVTGTAQLKGAPGQAGLAVAATGNVGIGTVSPTHSLHVSGNAIVTSSMSISGANLSGTTPVFQVEGGTLTVLANGNVGIGTENPAAKLAVTGSESSGQYIAVFNSGSKVAAWLRNK